MNYNEETHRLKFDLSEVLFCDTENKSLPFALASKCKVKSVKTWNDFMKTLNDATGVNDLTNKPVRQAYYSTVKVIVIDSFTRLTYLLGQHLKALNVKGFTYWGDYAEMLENLLMKQETNGRFIIYSGIDEVIKDIDSVDRKTVKVDGKKLEGLVESYFTITLFTHFNAIKPVNEAYQFCTNTDGRNSAKSPIGMFNERYIPNDMSLVLGRIYEYYEMSTHPEFQPTPILIVGKSGSGKSTSFMFLFNESDDAIKQPNKAKEKTK